MNFLPSGWLSVYKPLNISSSKTVLKIKKKFKLNKIGHAGTLDPLATGVLPIAFGSTTKIVSYAMKQNKKYRFAIKWGEQTNTDDSAGNIIFRSQKIPQKNEIKKQLLNFIGVIDQYPPKFSAIKINGKRAYDLSRKNEKFKITSRKVKVLSLKYVKDLNNCESLFELYCSSGFYVRSFARDFAILLGSRGHISYLERLEVGFFTLNNTILLDDLLKISHLSSRINGFFNSAVVLDDIPALTVKDEEISNISMGRKIDISHLNQKLLNIFHSAEIIYTQANNNLIALGKVKDNFFEPKKVLI